jgi:hypothetical protein
MRTETPLANASITELTAGVEENLFTLFRGMADVLPDSEILETENLSRYFAFSHYPMFKGVWRTRLTSSHFDAAIEESIAWYKVCKAPLFFWWTGPSSDFMFVTEI